MIKWIVSSDIMSLQIGSKSKERVWLTPRTFSQLTETVIHILFIWETTFHLLTKFVKLTPGTKPGSYPERVLQHVRLSMYRLLQVIEIWRSCHANLYCQQSEHVNRYMLC